MAVKTLVSLKYCCHVCSRQLSEPRYLRSHLITVHQIDLPKMPRGRQRFETDQYAYVQKVGNNAHENINEHFGCPSCLSHYDNMDKLRRHIENEHLQQNTSVDTSEGNGDQQRPKKRPREKTVHIGMSNRNIVTFSSTTYLYEQNTPKFPQKFIDDVRPIVSIDTALAEQSTLATLNAFHHARSFLMAALDQDQEQLATWLWTQKQHDITSREAKLLNMMKFILINFVDNCTATPISILNNTSTARKDYERTWWVRRVVPLFQTFGNQTGLLNFDWCECETTHHALEEMDLTIWEKGSSRFADGLGYDWNANERLVMEGSCGQHRESVSKTVDDSIKQLSSMIAMLKGIANIHLNARFDTMLRTKIFGVQSIKTSIVLSEVQFDENAKFSYRQVRKAEIPTSYKQRNKWLRVFELLAYLFVALDDQVVNMKQLDDEEDGAVNIPPQDTVRHKCLSV